MNRFEHENYIVILLYYYIITYFLSLPFSLPASLFLPSSSVIVGFTAGLFNSFKPSKNGRPSNVFFQRTDKYFIILFKLGW